MFHSIKSKLIVAGLVMAALLGGLTYFTSLELDKISATLTDLERQQEFKAHVLIPQKDMNQFIAAMDNTVLYLELGDPAGAQEAYNESVDAEQDIAAEFAVLEGKATAEGAEVDRGGDWKNEDGKLIALSEQAHTEWENATEFLKIHAEKVAAERGITLLRPNTEPTKTVDVHTEQAINDTKGQFASMSVAELEAIADDDAKNPVEIADTAIDGLEDATDEVLAAEQAEGDEALKSASTTITGGSLAVLVAVLAIGFLAATSVSRPLMSLKKGAERISEGELDYQFENVPADEVGDVIHSVQKMSGSLKDRIRTLEEVAGIVMLTGDDIEASAREIQPESPQSASILAKAGTLKQLISPVLEGKK